MLDPYLETVKFALIALGIGVLVFGGTTLTYFLDKRPPNSPKDGPAQPRHERPKATVTGIENRAGRDKAA